MNIKPRKPESIEQDAPSRTITLRSRMSRPIVKALYSVSENIALSNTSTPIHATAASAPLGYYGPMNRSE